jgi:hypothetical protein
MHADRIERQKMNAALNIVGTNQIAKSIPGMTLTISSKRSPEFNPRSDSENPENSAPIMPKQKGPHQWCSPFSFHWISD